MARTFQERYLKKKKQQRPQPQPQQQKQQKRPPQREGTKSTTTGPSDSLFGGEPTNKPSRSDLDWEALKTTAEAVPKAIPVSEPTTKPLVPGDYGYGHKNPRSSSQRGDVLLSKDAYPDIPTGFPPGKINTLPQEKPVMPTGYPTLPLDAKTPIIPAVEPTSGTPTTATSSKEPTSFFEDIPLAAPMSVPLSQPSSVTADDYSRMTGNFVDKTTGEAMKGPAETDVVGGKSESYDYGASKQSRQKRAEQFLKDLPAVDTAGKSRAQVQSEMADASEKYLKNVEEGEERPTRDVAVKRPLSERAPEYRDTKQGREYWEAAPKEMRGEELKKKYKFDPQQGGWGKWERNPIEDLNYPDERFRREVGPLKGDERTEMQKELQRNLAATLRSKLAIDPNYWRDPANAKELAKLKGRALRQGDGEVNLTSERFESFITKETKGAVIARDRARMLERQRAIVENPANWAMKGLQDPSDIAKTRKRMYPDQTAEQQEIIAEERRKAIEEYKKQRKDKDKE